MREENEYIKSVPYDLFELHLIHLVASHGSFTRAGMVAGLTQSAITRQIQGIEGRLGVTLFERTTRKVTLTAAGKFLLHETSHILGDVDASVRRIREEFVSAPRVVRAAVSRTISLAYLPGFFVQSRRRHPEVEITVAHESSSRILELLVSDTVDAGVLCPPKRLPTGLVIIHRFRDEFVLIAPENCDVPPRRKPASWRNWVVAQNWLLIHQGSETGRRLRLWMTGQNWKVRAAMEMDNFDLIINLVALGMGVSIVPHRALALYARKHGIRRHATPEKFSRELVVVTRRSQKPAAHVTDFVGDILF